MPVFAQRTLFEGLASVELALGERPVTAGLAVDAGDFNATTRNRARHDPARRANEIVGRVLGNDEFTTQEVHVANAKGRRAPTGGFLTLIWEKSIVT
jgi:hypothetical protein